MSNNDTTDDFVDENLVNEELGEEALAAPARDQDGELRLAPPQKRSGALRLFLVLLVLGVTGAGCFYFYSQMSAVEVLPLKPKVVAVGKPATPAASTASAASSLMSKVSMPAGLPPQPDADDSALVAADPFTASVPAAVPGLAPLDEPVPSAELPPEESMSAIGVPSGPPMAVPVMQKPGGLAVPAQKAAAPPKDMPNDLAPGELAIVQNDVILNGMGADTGSQPAVVVGPLASANDSPLGAAANLPVTGGPASARPAIVRPIPESFLTVRKERGAEDVDSRLTAARSALSQGRYAAALQLFNQLREDYPKDKRILTGRAVTLQKLGQIEDALMAYEETLTVDPRNIDALNNMLGLLKRQDPALALQKLAELREAYPYNSDITAQLAVAYAANADFSSALKYLDIADSLRPGNVVVLYNRAVLFDKMGRTAEAGSLYRQLVRMAAEGGLDMQGLPVEAIKQRLATIR